ncbi:MAG: hypothetical protein HYY18_17025 [Planctomycetes bacterium]|nr:hypothetical protein [Planctomycetota bacterium]
MRTIAVFLALATAAGAEDKPQWKLAKGDVLRYELVRTLEASPAPQITVNYLWDYTLELSVKEVKAGVATLEATLTAAKYESLFPGSPPCRFDSAKDRDRKDLEAPLVPWQGALGKKITVKVQLDGRIVSVEGLEAMFDVEHTQPYGEQGATCLREMLSLLFLDRSVKDGDAWRLGTNPYLVRPDMLLLEDVKLAAKAGGYTWTGTLTTPPPDEQHPQPTKLKDGWKSDGTAGWAAGRLKDLKVDTSLEYEEPLPVTAHLIRSVTAVKK